MQVNQGLLSREYFQLIKEKLDDNPTYVSFLLSRSCGMIFNDRMSDLKTLLECKQMKDESDSFSARDIQEEVKSLVNDDCFVIGLKPIIVAAMLCHRGAAEILLATGFCDVNVKDKGGATALYHASANGDEFLADMLRGYGATDECMKGVMSSSMLRQSYPRLNPAEHFFNYQQGNVITLETGVKFRALTGSILLTQDLFIHPQERFENWKISLDLQNEDVEFTSIDRQMLKLYEDFRFNQSPKLYLHSDPDVGHHLYAGEDIQPFTVLGEYLGEVDRQLCMQKQQRLNEEIKAHKRDKPTDEDEEKFLYPGHDEHHYLIGGRTIYEKVKTPYGALQLKEKTIDTIDGYAYRGLMAMINCSFPNVMARPVKCKDGRQRVLMITTELIKRDNPLAYDYGRHSVKRMKYREMRLDSMREFFSTHNTLERLMRHMPKQSSKSSKNLNELFCQIADEMKLMYLLNTPTAVLWLYLNRIISWDVIYDLFQHKALLERGKNDYGQTLEGQFLWELNGLIQKREMTREEKSGLLNAIGNEDLLALYRRITRMNNQ